MVSTPIGAVVSDLLISLESDGRSHTVQHTIASNGRLVILNLPGSVIPQTVRFMGPERVTFRTAYQHRPERLSLWSGSAFARYHHQYGDSVEQTLPGEFRLTTSSLPNNLVFDPGTLTESSITWVFPSEFEIVSYTITTPDTGNWVAENNTLTFHQTGPNPVNLGIEYRYRVEVPATATAIDQCAAGTAPIDACAPDEDADGVPDYRDVCIDSSIATVSAFGCAVSNSLLLDGITFVSGRSYLDMTARRILDRVALSLQRHSDKFFEIGAHTDNLGSAQRNLNLSRKRANAVRHYLMLRGDGPNQVRATGYGEAFPVHDNTDAKGQRANRRIELTYRE